jgi:DNA-binding winged helix-turn-helix (wHTH) protein
LRVRVGEFTLDLASRQLLRASREVRLRTKAFELLGLLVRRRPAAVSKSHIRDALWPRTHVSESTLATVVAELRAALRDSSRRPRYIRTVHGFGYACCAPGSGEAMAERDRFSLRWGEREIPLDAGENVIGRAEDVAATIGAATVSRHHARIAISGTTAVLEDLGSKNGTFVGSEKLQGSRVLSDGDVIRLGSVRVTFRAAAGALTTETEPGA